MYEEIGQVSKTTVVQLKKLLDSSPWEIHVSDATEHHAFSCLYSIRRVKEIVAKWPIDTWEGMTFLRLPPKGKLYRHHDEGYGYHIPVETNEDAITMTYKNGAQNKQHLEVGKIYKIDRSLEHESFNNGDSDRTHLIVLLKETQ